MSQSVRTTNRQSFDHDVLSADQPVLVDFYADWCAPCKAIAPVVEDLATTYEGRVEFRKVDVDSNPELAQKFGIRGIPTLLLFKNGSPVETVVGNVSRSALTDVINQHIA